MKGILNIGVRHVLPTFPFIYLLVARELAAWIYRPASDSPNGLMDWINLIYEKIFEPLPKILFLALMFLWIFGSAILTYPYYLSYYNEFVGIDNGYKYIGDSNYDWGQDLKELKKWADLHPEAGRIAIDYFGAGDPKYYLGDRAEYWWSAKGSPAAEGISWFAISVDALQRATQPTVSGFTRKPEDEYSWLDASSPDDRAGTSIFLYRL